MTHTGTATKHYQTEQDDVFTTVNMFCQVTKQFTRLRTFRHLITATQEPMATQLVSGSNWLNLSPIHGTVRPRGGDTDMSLPRNPQDRSR